jgi:Protein of unknown function, DUF481
LRPSLLIGIVCLALSLSGAAHAHSQNAPPTPPPPGIQAAPTNLLRIFLDCDQCDDDYMRQNVAFVDYVRDRAVADIHVLVTTQRTGGGGLAWTVKFIGLGRLLGQDRTLSFTTLETATDDDRRKEFARIFKIGLVSLAAETAAGPQLDVTWTRPAASVQTTPQKDRWNYWVFRANANGNVNGEHLQNFQSYRLNFSGNRTTDQWKINLNANGSYNESVFDIEEDGTTIRSTSDSWNVNSLVVKSLSPQWSFGSRASINHSSFSNNDRSITVAPGPEYNFFPYSESARRSLTIQYTIGITANEYQEITIYDKLHEVVPNHRVFSALGLKQPWGSVEIESALNEHLDHPDRYRFTIFGSADVRLFKGFSFNIFGEYEKIKDQISLPKGSASTEEILLRQRQLATSYSYFVAFGISYSFGSIFNSVVNTRFGG